MLATKGGLVKKSRLTDFDSPRAGGIIAINLREDDEVIAARLISPDQDLLLVSRKAQSLRFHATDETLRPMGRATSGVIGMRFADGDELLGMYVVREGADVLVATAGGYAKRTPVDEYPIKGRGGRGVVTARIVDPRGELVGALMVHPEDEVFAITSAGGVIRTAGRRGQAVRPADDGRAADEPRHRGQRGGHRTQRRGHGRSRSGGRRADEAGWTRTRPSPADEGPDDPGRTEPDIEPGTQVLT